MLNLKLKGEVENWSFWIKKVSNVFYQFSFPIQYFDNLWIIHNALRSVSCSSYLQVKKKKLVSIIRPRGLLHCQKKGVNSKTLFLVTKFGFCHTVFLFLFHPKWVDKVNLYGPKIKKSTISRMARRGNTDLFGLGGYVSLGYNVFWVLSLKKGPPAPLLKASLSAPSPRTIYILIQLSVIK